ncbi:MAG: cell division protein ZapA [Alphaproteobacteria bacterium]|nr:cell division protein ZapA [Alphaproteobacteria bacterium]
MAQVSIQINGRDYLIACEDGEEKHLTFLADYVNRQVDGLVESVGQVGEARLLLMASLMVADELAEASQELEELKAGGEIAGGTAGEPVAPVDLAKLTQRIEDIAARLESA